MRHANYRSLLLDELENRRKVRPRLSMNAFARLLQLTPGHFNDLIRERRGLSQAKASEVAARLNLPRHEREFFLLSVKAEHGRSQADRQTARRELEVIKTQKISILKLDLFNLISQWHHMAILELTRLDEFKADTGWIARKLGLTRATVESAVDRLISLGLIQVADGRWTVHEGMLRTADDIPSLAAKSHHSQVMNLASRALHEQTVDKREFLTLMMAIDSKKMTGAKEKIRNFQREMSEYLTGSKDKRDQLYCLSLQLFSLTQDCKAGH